MKRFAFVLVSLAMLGFGCRGGSNNPGDDDDDDVDASSGDITIQQVQDDSMAPGTPVSLGGVIVTAIDKFGDRAGDIWVQEPGGGEFSGIHVYGAPVDQVAALQIGDVVNITGAEKDEFAINTDTSGNSVTELKPVSGGEMAVTKVSSGTAPEPQLVDALVIGQKPTEAERNAEWEKWEGVLITVANVTQLNSVQNVGGMTPDPTLKKFDVTGSLVVESALSAFPTMGLTRNGCLASTTGVLDYIFDYMVFPRSTDEIVMGGTACPPPEASPAVCADAIDNDGNGFNDCKDNGCIVGDETCRSTTTIGDLQATTPEGGVKVESVVVTAISKNKKNMWVQTDMAAGPNQGVYVFGPGMDLEFAVGSRVDIIGTVEEFNDSMGTETLTEIKALAITQAEGTGTVTPVTNQTVMSLSDPSTGEPYEGVLVTLSNVEVMVIGTTGNGGTFGVGSLKQGTKMFKTDDDIFLLPMGELSKCYGTITGIWTYMPYDNQYGFLPLSKGTGSGSCD
ncbi:MAG: hypothetical protein AB7O24_25140 [Kofleriaceae bacterium]